MSLRQIKPEKNLTRIVDLCGHVRLGLDGKKLHQTPAKCLQGTEQ